jgi:acyl-CoA reductase-like NAD-dependent aldehyde dehydrogenase
MNTIMKHYIDGAVVESHGREVMDIINPTNRQVIAQVMLADDEGRARALGASRQGRRRPATLMIASLRYLDTFVKMGGDWLFAEHLLYVD